MENETVSKNFIENIIDKDLAEGVYDTVDNADILRGVEMNKLSIPNEIKFSIEKVVPTTSGTQNWRLFIWTNDFKPVVDMIK